MKRTRIIVMVLVLMLVFACGCSFSSSLSSMDEDFSEPEVVSPSSSLSADSLDESESVGSVSSSSIADEFWSPSFVGFFERHPSELLHTTEGGNVWRVGVGYHDPDDTVDFYDICVTLSNDYHVENGLIYSYERKMNSYGYEGEVKLGDLSGIGLTEERSMLDLFEETRTGEYLVAILDEGGYTDNDGREIYYMVTESDYDGSTYIYDYCIEIIEGVVIRAFFYTDEYAPEKMRPLYESIIESIRPYEA